jgi:predicted nucleic acid-binding protein
LIAVTLDTGVLIAMEKNKARAMMLLRAAREQRAELFATTPVIAEWWRGRTDRRDAIRRAVTVVDFPLAAAEASGMVLGQLRDTRERVKLAIDVMVMAFAALHGGALVYTTDPAGLTRIQPYFPAVRISSL